MEKEWACHNALPSLLFLKFSSLSLSLHICFLACMLFVLPSYTNFEKGCTHAHATREAGGGGEEEQTKQGKAEKGREGRGFETFWACFFASMACGAWAVAGTGRNRNRGLPCQEKQALPPFFLSSHLSSSSIIIIIISVSVCHHLYLSCLPTLLPPELDFFWWSLLLFPISGRLSLNGPYRHGSSGCHLPLT